MTGISWTNLVPTLIDGYLHASIVTVTLVTSAVTGWLAWIRVYWGGKGDRVAVIAKRSDFLPNSLIPARGVQPFR
jgi:hypothetical protein